MRRTWEGSSARMIVRVTLLLMLSAISVIGKSGTEFPAFPNIPNTGFSCNNVPTGYYADLETDCQVFHICETSRKISFLCPNGTIFSQSHLICDWWFKVDCASTPSFYESSAEYRSNEQKEIPKIAQILSKSADPHQVEATTNILTDIRRASVNIPGATKRLLRYRHMIQPQTTAKNVQSIFSETTLNPVQKNKSATTIRKHRKNVAQPTINNFVNVPTTLSTSPTNIGARVYKGTSEAANNITETQIAAETASLVNSNNRKFLQDNNINIFRPYALYTPNLTVQPIKIKSNPRNNRPSLVPYTKHYTTIVNGRAPYRRPGVSLLKDFIEKEKNKTLITITEKISQAADMLKSNNNVENKISIDTKYNVEPSTKLPLTTWTGNTYVGETAPSDRYDVYSSLNQLSHITTEPSYQEQRERLILGTYGSTETSVPTTITEKYYRTLPTTPGFIFSSSLTPKTRNDLAIYYATDSDNLSTIQPPVETGATTSEFDRNDNIGDGLLTLFSIHTINNYSNLFSDVKDTSKLLEVMKLDPKGVYNKLSEDLNVQQTQNRLATAPQIRELAQIFTHALSAYLQNPEHFRKVLTDVRPTHPPVNNIITHGKEIFNTDLATTINDEDHEILGFSEDNKARLPLASFRDSLVLATDYPTISEEFATSSRPIKTDAPTLSATPWSPFKCCGKISASYTTKFQDLSSQFIPTTTVSSIDNTLVNSYDDIYDSTTTENSYGQKYGGFQNNTVLFNHDKRVYPEAKNTKPSNEHVLAKSVISTRTSSTPNTFEYFVETNRSKLANDEELQRSDSKSYFTPYTTQKNNLRQGKFNFAKFKTNIKYRELSENLEAPTTPIDFTSITEQTTAQPSTTVKIEDTEALITKPSLYSSIFTLPASDKTTELQWPNTIDSWHSTIIDPITLNYNLSTTRFDHISQQDIRQTNNTETIFSPRYTRISDRVLSSQSTTESTTPDKTKIDRVVQKTKEGMNATTTEKLMNIMHKTKSNTIKRLILLLVQTCDNEYNTTAEASKKTLLEALTAISQNDIDEIAKDQRTADGPTTEADYYATNMKDFLRRMNRVIETKEIKPRDLKTTEEDIDFNSSLINYSSNPLTSESTEPSETFTETTQSTTTTAINRRGAKKFLARNYFDPTTEEVHVAEVNMTPQRAALNSATDTRALELLRSLYTVAARWG